MTRYEFVLLPIDDQANTVWDRGECVSSVIDPLGRSTFYVVSDFYVQVDVVVLEGKETLNIIGFKEGDRYERMLTGVST